MSFFPIIPPGSYPPVAVTYTASTSSGTAGTSFSFASQSIGTASSDRYVLVAVRTTTAISTVTVAGQTATQIASLTGASGNTRNYFYIVALTTGTTATIAVTTSSSSSSCAIIVWAVTNLSSTTPTSTVTDASGALSQSVTIPAEGAAVAFFGCTDNANTAWTLTGVAEDADLGGRGTSDSRVAGGHKESTAGETLTVAGSGPSNLDAMLVVTLR